MRRLAAPVAVLAGGHGTRLGDVAQARRRPSHRWRVSRSSSTSCACSPVTALGVRALLGHLGEQIVDAVGDGARFGLEVRYAFDGPSPSERPVPLRRALPLLGDAFLVTYGDAT